MFNDSAFFERTLRGRFREKRCNNKKNACFFWIFIHTRIDHHQTSFDNPARRCFASELQPRSPEGARPVFKSGAFGGQDFTFNGSQNGKIFTFQQNERNQRLNVNRYFQVMKIKLSNMRFKCFIDILALWLSFLLFASLREMAMFGFSRSWIHLCNGNEQCLEKPKKIIGNFHGTSWNPLNPDSSYIFTYI